MATVTAIPEKTQSKTAMSKVMKYVSQDKKTLFERDDRQYKLLSGKDCCAETAFSEFMATKRQYAKEKGVYFYQYVQSFKPEENVSPEEIHQIGRELAEYFKGYEVLIATHIDADHKHNHLIVNSVSSETGLKLQFNEQNLSELRNLSDEICKSNGLTVLKPYEKQDKKSINTREYRAALRGYSWKFKLMSQIDEAMDKSHTKAEFITNMEQKGYQVKWISHYKYITYTTPEGQKCRDNRLHDDKYLKTNMEGYYGLAEFKATKQRGANLEPAISSADMRHSERAMGGNAELANRHSASTATDERNDNRTADNSRYNGNDEGLLSVGVRFSDRNPENKNFRRTSEHQQYDGERTSENDGNNVGENFQSAENNGADAQTQGYVGANAQSKVVGNRSLDLDDILYLAKTVEDLVNPYPQKENQQQKKSKPIRKKKIKRRTQSQDYYDDWDMEI